LKKLPKYKEVFVIVLAIIIVASFSLQVQQSAENWIFWKMDDANHLGGAYNLFHGNGYSNGFLLLGDTANQVIANSRLFSTAIMPIHEKGPIYCLVLGSYLYITGSSPSNWYVMTQLFNFALTSVFLLLYFFWARNYFGFSIASISTIFVAALPFIFWEATRIVVEPLFYILLIGTLMVVTRLEKNGLKAVLALGLLAGLAALTHPQGIVLGVCLFFFFVFKRQIKSLGVFASVFILVLIPWMVRNIFYYGNFTLGLAIPAPSYLVQLLSFNVHPIYGLPSSSTTLIFHTISLPTMFAEFVQRLNSEYNMVTITFILVIFAVIGYLYSIVWSADKKSKKSTNMLILIYAIANLIGYFYIAAIVGTTPEPRFLFASLLLGLGFSFVGIKQLSIILKRITKNRLSSKIFSIVFVSLLFVMVISSSVSSVAIINSVQIPGGETDAQKPMDIWLRDNIPKSDVIGSNFPEAVYLRTGLTTVQLSDDLLINNFTVLESAINQFNIKYVVFYSSHYNPNQPINHLLLHEVFSNGLDKVYSVDV
jgi:hypothetical protein